MKERCVRCKDFFNGSCEAWKGYGFEFDIDPNLTPLQNLKGQNRIIYWFAEKVLLRVNKNACFQPKEIPQRNYY